MRVIEAQLASKTKTLRIKFLDGEVFILRDIVRVEGDRREDAKFSATIVLAENLSEARRKLFRSGSALDFLERDVREITEYRP